MEFADVSLGLFHDNNFYFLARTYDDDFNFYDQVTA